MKSRPSLGFPTYKLATRGGLRASTLLLACCALAVQACTPRFQRAPTTPSREELFAQASVVPEGLAEDPPAALQLYPGDVITLISQSADREEQPGLHVDDRGVVHVPLAGDVAVTGMPITEAERALETALRQYDRSVRVSVLISEPAGHMCAVVGAVAVPGRVPVVGGMRVTDLLAHAGGPFRGDRENPLSPVADLAGARLVRNGEPLPISIPLALAGDPRHNVRVHPGDMLNVPASLPHLVTVIGQVESSGIFVYRPGIRLSQAVALAGGVTRDGDWGDVRVIRGDSEHPRIYQAGVADIVDGRSPDVVLAPGDVIYVSSAGHADLRDVMNSISAFLSMASTGAFLAVPSLTR